MKKLVVLLLFVFLLFNVYIFISKMPHSYSIQYKLNDYNVNESYDLNNEAYTLLITQGNEEYYFSYKDDFHSKRKIITNIENKDNCLIIYSKAFESYSLCKKYDLYYSNFNLDNINNKVTDKYEKIDIYDLVKHKFLIWDYDHFIYLNGNKKKSKDLFDDDIYNMNLFYQLDEYLVIPDYANKYSFSSFYMINSNNFKINKAELNISFSFDSYFLGNYKDDIYLYDKKKEQEYRINLFKEEAYKNKYEYLDNNKWYDTSKKYLNRESIHFNQTKTHYFDVVDKALLYHTPHNDIIVINKVDYLVKSTDKEAFFISDGVLYYTDVYHTLKRVMAYDEWLYNFGNIFPF